MARDARRAFSVDATAYDFFRKKRCSFYRKPGKSDVPFHKKQGSRGSLFASWKAPESLLNRSRRLPEESCHRHREPEALARGNIRVAGAAGVQRKEVEAHGRRVAHPGLPLVAHARLDQPMGALDVQARLAVDRRLRRVELARRAFRHRVFFL